MIYTNLKANLWAITTCKRKTSFLRPHRYCWRTYRSSSAKYRLLISCHTEVPNKHHQQQRPVVIVEDPTKRCPEVGDNPGLGEDPSVKRLQTTPKRIVSIQNSFKPRNAFNVVGENGFPLPNYSDWEDNLVVEDPLTRSKATKLLWLWYFYLHVRRIPLWGTIILFWPKCSNLAPKVNKRDFWSSRRYNNTVVL